MFFYDWEKNVLGDDGSRTRPTLPSPGRPAPGARAPRSRSLFESVKLAAKRPPTVPAGHPHRRDDGVAEKQSTVVCGRRRRSQR